MILLGDEYIFQAALGLLKLLESKLVSIDDLGEIASVLKELMHSRVLSEVSDFAASTVNSSLWFATQNFAMWQALFEHASTQSLVFKDEETLKRRRWHSLYASADKMKLKSALWQQLLSDLHVLKQQIEASDIASNEVKAAGNNDILKLVLALENLDVDETVCSQLCLSQTPYC